jgi:hypothetical protein
MSIYDSLFQDAFRPIEKKETPIVNYPYDLSKLIRQGDNIYFKDKGIRYIDPDTKIVYVYKKRTGQIMEEEMSNDYRSKFFGDSYLIS